MSPSSPKFFQSEKRYPYVFFVCFLGTFAVGSLVLTGWIFNIAILRTFVPNYVSMKPNVSIGLICGAMALLFLYNESASKRCQTLGRCLSAFLIILGAATLSQYVFDIDLGIDLLFFAQVPANSETNPAGRMSHQTAINFILIGAALLSLDWETNSGRRPSQWLSIAGAILPLQALIAYSYGVQSLLGIGNYVIVNQMAVHTAFAWVLMCIGTLYARPNVGIMNIVTGSSYAGYMSRRLLLPSLLIPLILGYTITAGEHLKLFQPDFGYSVLILMCIIIFASIVWLSTSGLHKMELDRASNDAHLSLALDISKMGTWVHDYRKDVVLHWTNQTKAIYGLPLDVEPSLELWERSVHPEDLPKIRAALAAAFAKREDFFFQHRVIWPDGSIRWIEVKSRATFDDVTGKRLRILGVSIDITEKVMTDQERTENLAREQTAIQTAALKSEFLANISHEIRTPINGVMGMTTLLGESPLSLKQRDYLDNIKRSSETLLTVINDLLDFAKVETGKLSLEIVDFDLEPIISDIGKTLSLSAKHKGLRTNVQSPAALNHLFKGDPARLRQILLNLIHNAVKFTASGAVETRITLLEDTASHTSLKFEVQDTGIGISPSKQALLFEAFAQADTSTTRQFGGTGLGLSLSKKLVELMNGNIGVRSHEGEGSTFWFTIQLPKAAARPQAQKDKNPFALVPYLQGLRVLVAEDNTINQKVALGILAKLGCSAIAVANGKEALLALQDLTYDLILMDCQMPELDGYETTMRIREDRTTSFHTIPIVALTANAIKGDRERCLAAGMNDYISKPLKVGELVEVLDRHLKKPA